MAGLGVAAVVEGGLNAVVGFGVGVLGAVVGRVGDLDEAPAVEPIIVVKPMPLRSALVFFGL